MNDEPTLCVFCRHPVETITLEAYGTVWIHEDGYRECPPRYASPDFINKDRKAGQ